MKAKYFYTINEIAAYAAKLGHNEKDAKHVVARNYDYMKRMYKDASLRKLVHIAYVLY
jgi:hypothetical protein